MIANKRKRLYRAASVVECGGGYAVALDDAVLKTPAGMDVVVPGRALAQAIADEWQAQGSDIDPATMPLTRLANSAIDRIAASREGAIKSLAAYAESDLLCYRADEPPELVTAQNEAFQPLLDWVSQRFGAEFNITSGIMPVAQPRAAVSALTKAIAAFDDMMLAALGLATISCGSLVLALALAEGRVGAEEAAALAETDELYQAGRWGFDPAYVGRHELVVRDIASAARFMELCRA